MDYSKTWGYKLLTETSLEISHILLDQIEPKILADKLSDFKEIVVKKDGSVIVHLNSPEDLNHVLEKFKLIFSEIEARFAITPNYEYKINEDKKRVLKEWLLSLEGAVAIILSKTLPQHFSSYNWELINSPIGGIYMEPFTIIFNEDHPKVIHPIALNNYVARNEIEQEVATCIRGILNRVKEAQPGYEGLAIVSYVETKTALDVSIISSVINEKTRQIRTPRYSPLIRI